MITIKRFLFALVLPAFLLGCGRTELKQTVEKQAVTIAALEAEIATLKKARGNSVPTAAISKNGRKVVVTTVTGKIIENGSFDYLTTGGRFSLDPEKKDLLPVRVDGVRVELKAAQLKKVEVTGLIPEGPKTYGWKAAAVTVTTTEKQTVAGQCHPDQLYFHVIVPASFTLASLPGMFRTSDEPLRALPSGELKEVDGKKILAIPVAQLGSLTFD